MSYLHRKLKNYRLETKVFKTRLFIAAVAIAVMMGILVLRLAYLQIFAHKYYQQLATHNQLEMLAIEPNRGLIFDRNGVLLADNAPIFTLSIIPDYIPNLKDTLQGLQKLISIKPGDLDQFYKNLKQHKKFAHIPLKYKLTQDEVENFYANQFRFPGVVIDAGLVRHYPFGSATASIIGYIGKLTVRDLSSIDLSNYTVDSSIGKIGIEKYYEKLLHGKTGYRQVEIDATGHIVHDLGNINPTPGNNLFLTIDSKLQMAAQQALGDTKGAVVAIDPNNGEILALVSNPSYDPNLFAYGIDPAVFQQLQNAPDKPMYNRAIRGVFPFGSTIKPFLALEALDTGVVDTKYSIYDPGWFKLPNSSHVYRDWRPHGHGSVNITKAIVESCDTFFYGLGPKMGINKIDDILLRFGFGSKTNIDLDEGPSGIIASPKWLAASGKIWYPGFTVLAAIGQGFMSTTPLQLAIGTATLAERGQRYQPHFLLKVQEPLQNKISLQPIQSLSPVVLKEAKNWDVVINAMKNVVMSPTGTAYVPFGGKTVTYTVAGKSGTAQLFRHKFNTKTQEFEKESSMPKDLRNHSLFVAFAPVEKPKIAIAVIAENSTAAKAITRKALDCYLAPEVAAKAAAAAAAKAKAEEDEESDQDDEEDSDSSDSSEVSHEAGADE